MLSWVINMRWNSLFQFDFLMAWSICSWIAIMHGPRLIGWYCKLCMWKLKLLGLSWVIYIEARFAPLDCIHVWTMHAVFVQKEEGWTSYYLNFLFVGVMYYKYKQLLFIWGFFFLSELSGRKYFPLLQFSSVESERTLSLPAAHFCIHYYSFFGLTFSWVYTMGGRGISDVSPLSGMSELSVWSHFSISPLVLLPSPVALSVLSFSAFGPFSWSPFPY